MLPKNFTIASVGIAAIAVIAYTFLESGGEQRRTTASVQPSDSPASALTSNAARLTTGDVIGATSSPASAGAVSSLSRSISELSKSSNPEDAFAAYLLIKKCVDARRDELYVADRVARGESTPAKTAIEICADIDPGQVASRLQLLHRATEAGVHGAAASFADAVAANGFSLETRLDDPEYVAAQDELGRAIEKGAANGDWWSLGRMADKLESPQSGQADYVAALGYLEKSNAAYKAERGTDFKSYEMEKAKLQYKIKKSQDEVSSTSQ